jgi:uncharacterized delta-60 repeat protein
VPSESPASAAMQPARRTMCRRLTTCGMLAVLAASGWSFVADTVGAIAGDLDPGFGTGGKVTTDFFGGIDQAFAVAIQPNGRIVVAGRHSVPTDVEGLASDFAIARYADDGSLDTGFGTGGRVVTDFGGSESVRALAIQNDGKIVAAGGRGLGRYNENGSLDTSFGPAQDGKVVTSAFDAVGVAVDSDGRIVIAGTTNFDFGLARYDSNGSIDISFGSGFSGRVASDFGDTEFASALAVEPSDGRLLVAGSARNPATGTYRFIVARYNPNGSLDSTFGNGGRVFTTIGSQSFASGMTIQSDGKIVVVGEANDFSTGLTGFALARYNPDGSLDPTFGSGGTVLTLRLAARGFGVTVLPDGRIVAVGANPFLIIAYKANGDPETRFGPNGDGQLVTSFGGPAHANAVVPIGEHGMIVAGSGNSRADFAVARYDTTPPPNEPAVVDAGTTGGAIDAGGRFTHVGSFVDPDSTAWTATVDYGDGTGVRPLALDGTTFFLNHAYSDGGRYTVTVCITDEHGATSCGTVTVTVANAPQFASPSCVDNVRGQFNALKHHGEALGFHLGAGTPEPTLSRHYQGIQRMPRPNGAPVFYVTRSGKGTPTEIPPSGSDPGNLLIVRFDSRDTNGERMRSNRVGAGQDTEDTPPPAEDAVVRNITFHGGADDEGVTWPAYEHPGGMQLLEDLLFIPLESRIFEANPKVRLVVADVQDPEHPKVLHTLDLPGQGDSAGIAAVARDPATRLIWLIVPGPDSDFLRIYRSNSDDARAEGFQFEHFDTWQSDELIGGRWPTDNADVPVIGPVIHGSNQSLYLVNDCAGGLYMLAARNTKGGGSIPFNEDRIALYRLTINTNTPNVDITQVEDRHVWCESSGAGLVCDLAAASGFYVSPAGELILYATEHEHGGPDGTVRMAEFRSSRLFRVGSPNWAPTAQITAPQTIDAGTSITISGSASRPPVAKPWAELYEDEDLEDRSLVLDWDDRFRGEFASLGDLDDWDDEADSVVYAAPIGCDLDLAEDPHFGGRHVVLPGKGRVDTVPNLNDNAYAIGDEIDAVQFTGSSCGADALTYSWDLDDDGVFETSGMSATLHPSRSGSVRVALRVCGAFLQCDEDLRVIDVRDPTPTIATFTVSPEAEEGHEVVTAGAISNPANRAVTITIDWGDGTVDATGSQSIAGLHIYADNGVYAVQATLCDADQHCDSRSAAVVVHNAPPVADPGADVTLQEGSLLLRTAIVTDAGFTSARAGTQETLTATVNWGDSPAILPLPLEITPGGPGAPTVARGLASHAYVDDGTFTITLRATDDDGGVGAGLARVFVTNAPPVARVTGIRDEGGRAIGPSDVVPAGVRVDLVAAFTDAGVQDTHTAMVDWGDQAAGPGTVDATTRTVQASHTFTASSASRGLPFNTVRLRVVDDDGGAGSAAVHLIVVDAAGAVARAVDDLQALASDATLPAAARTALLKAINDLQGGNGGSGANGAIDKLADGRLAAALNKVGDALGRLEAAGLAARSTDLGATASLLVLTAKAVAADAIARAQATATRPRDFSAIADAAARVAEGDAMRLAGKNAEAVDKYQDAVRRVRRLL